MFVPTLYPLLASFDVKIGKIAEEGNRQQALGTRGEKSGGGGEKRADRWGGGGEEEGGGGGGGGVRRLEEGERWEGCER